MTLRSVAQLRFRPGFWLLLAMLVTAAAYLPGAAGGYLFDDFPNIVDNDGIHITNWSVPSLASAALSSPSSEFKRPLASLTFALNYLLGGLDPLGMKVTNIVIHLLNGLVAFALLRLLFSGGVRTPTRNDDMNAVIVTALWLVMPINLTAVLYVVQRMESLANLFVLLALLGYLIGRRRMLAGRDGFLLAASSLIIGTALGLLSKETAILTPLYAGLLEWLVLGWRAYPATPTRAVSRKVVGLFVVILVVPFIAGAIVVGPSLFAHSTWASRNFTMPERLLSECRIVADYIVWTLLPTPSDLSFYHDDFVTSTGWTQPWATLVSGLVLGALAVTGVAARKRMPLFALGITWFFACHVLTATIIPLELIYEHRNYFSSLGLVLALVAFMRGIGNAEVQQTPGRRGGSIILAVLGAYLVAMTAFTATRWATPLSLAQELANRAPMSPRAQYELGRTYVITSAYNPDSPFIAPAYRALERAAALPRSSTLPEQALIFFAAKLDHPVKDEWWQSMETKLRANPIAIEDESAIMSLSTCALQKGCNLPNDKLLGLYLAALSHPAPHSRLLAAYSEFAWAALGDHPLGYSMIRKATEVEPSEPSYHITTLRYAIAMDDLAMARDQLSRLQRLNVGGRLSSQISLLQAQIDVASASTAAPPQS